MAYIIDLMRKAIEPVEIEEKDERDYYNDPSRRLEILARDKNGCIY